MKKLVFKALLATFIACSPITPLSVTNAEAKTSIKIGAVIGTKLPHGAVSIKVGKENYHAYKGVYYRKTARGYKVVKAPRGAVIRHLPNGYKRILVRGKTYFRVHDVYYIKASRGFRVVDAPTIVDTASESNPPPASSLESVPEAPFTVWLGERELILKDGHFFRNSPQGPIWVDTPYGATKKELPNETTSVWYQDIEYFEIESVYFQKTSDGYRIIPAPWERS